MQAVNNERIRNEITACRRAGSERRFRDAIRTADVALATIASSSCHDDGESQRDGRRLARQRAAALGYRGMALLELGELDEAALTLEESCNLFHERRPACSDARNKDASTTPPPLLDRVTACLVRACAALGRSPPLPPLAKFPRTPHLFRPAGSRAVTEDDLVLAEDDTLFDLLLGRDRNNNATTRVISLEEKIDGANLGISLSLDGREVLVQNRSHYISHGEHAQFSSLRSWIELHGEEIRRILLRPDGESSSPSSSSSWSSSPTISKRRILYGEWVVARHSIPYDRLPGYFIAFDISEDGRFVSRRRFRNAMRGSGIPVAPTLPPPPDLLAAGPEERGGMKRILMDTIMQTPSEFRADGGKIEGVVIRVDDGDWMEHRCKLVDPDFTAGIDGHWARSKIEKQRVDMDFASRYVEECCGISATGGRDEVSNALSDPRQRAVVSYQEVNGQMSATCTVLRKEPSSCTEGTVVLPRNLCWLWQDEVLVSSAPKSEAQIRAMRDALNVGLVITLTKEEPLPAEWFPPGGGDDGGCCENFFCPVADGMPPTMRQMDDLGDAVVRTASAGRAVLEHCGGGKGRAGTVAVCLLLRFGWDGVRARIATENGDDGREAVGAGEGGGGARSLLPRRPFMSGEEAIAEIRLRRPGSLETVVQEDFVREYAQHLWRKAADEEAREAFTETFLGACVRTHEANAHASINDKVARRSVVPKYVVLAGLPGSGKSTLAKRLCFRDAKNANSERVHASTDDMGKRLCCDVVGHVAAMVSQGRAGGIIIDACNINASKRREWLDIMHRPSRDLTALVFLDAPTESCIARVRYRVDHPTIPYGRGGRVVESFAKSMELPTAKEKELFGKIVVLQSRDEICLLLESWGVAC